MADIKGGHLSRSDVQEEAEEWVLNVLRGERGSSTLEKRDVSIGSSHCKPDGVTEDGGRLVEVYARVGKLKGAQQKKITADILKFATIRNLDEYPNARCEIYFVDAEARNSITGWKKEAADRFGVDLKLIEIPQSLREKLLVAQAGQAEGMKGLAADGSD